jgi:hypothetical protein
VNEKKIIRVLKLASARHGGAEQMTLGYFAKDAGGHAQNIVDDLNKQVLDTRHALIEVDAIHLDDHETRIAVGGGVDSFRVFPLLKSESQFYYQRGIHKIHHQLTERERKAVLDSYRDDALREARAEYESMRALVKVPVPE